MLVIILCLVIFFVFASRLIYKYGVQFMQDLTTLGNGKSMVSLRLIEKEQISPTTCRFRFALPSEEHTLGLPIGQHVILQYMDKITGEYVERSYTPITTNRQKGYMDLVIKIYPKTLQYPKGGLMSQYLNHMLIGSLITVTGPKGRLSYQQNGIFHITTLNRIEKRRPTTRIGMIAGGTGITPMFQIMKHILQDEKNKTIELFLLYANQSEDDILLKKELEEMQKQHTNVHIWYTVDQKASSKWKYSQGYITEEMIKEHIPAPSSTTQVFICGPPLMIKHAVRPSLQSLGYSTDMYFVF